MTNEYVPVGPNVPETHLKPLQDVPPVVRKKVFCHFDLELAEIERRKPELLMYDPDEQFEQAEAPVDRSHKYSAVFIHAKLRLARLTARRTSDSRKCSRNTRNAQ